MTKSAPLLEIKPESPGMVWQYDFRKQKYTKVEVPVNKDEGGIGGITFVDRSKKYIPNGKKFHFTQGFHLSPEVDKNGNPLFIRKILKSPQQRKKEYENYKNLRTLLLEVGKLPSSSNERKEKWEAYEKMQSALRIKYGYK